MPGALLTTRLRELHEKSNWPLILPNVWDAASARIVEAAGFPCVATSSAGVAYSLGYSDGQHIGRDEMLDAIARIVRAIRVPVTADIEAGYGDAPGTAQALLEIGASGMNLEDYTEDLISLEEQVEIIQAVRAAAPDIVINARTDIYLAQVGEESTRFERTVERQRAFIQAGADCVFVPGVRDEQAIAGLASEVDAPLNILATAGSPSVARLAALGVGRISFGSGPMRATMALMRRIALEAKDTGTYESFTTDTIPYAEVNRLFER
jgi:2-methylisocitrate lyase-like PEP mutase family enzyme